MKTLSDMLMHVLWASVEIHHFFQLFAEHDLRHTHTRSHDHSQDFNILLFLQHMSINSDLYTKFGFCIKFMTPNESCIIKEYPNIRQFIYSLSVSARNWINIVQEFLIRSPAATDVLERKALKDKLDKDDIKELQIAFAKNIEEFSNIDFGVYSMIRNEFHNIQYTDAFVQIIKEFLKITTGSAVSGNCEDESESESESESEDTCEDESKSESENSCEDNSEDSSEGNYEDRYKQQRKELAKNLKHNKRITDFFSKSENESNIFDNNPFWEISQPDIITDNISDFDEDAREKFIAMINKQHTFSKYEHDVLTMKVFVNNYHQLLKFLYSYRECKRTLLNRINFTDLKNVEITSQAILNNIISDKLDNPSKFKIIVSFAEKFISGLCNCLEISNPNIISIPGEFTARTIDNDIASHDLRKMTLIKPIYGINVFGGTNSLYIAYVKHFDNACNSRIVKEVISSLSRECK